VQIVCPACDAIKRIPLDKPAGEGRCGKCHKELFNGMPLELTAERFERHLHQSSIPLLVDRFHASQAPSRKRSG
jgi:thioredoxin 2